MKMLYDMSRILSKSTASSPIALLSVALINSTSSGEACSEHGIAEHEEVNTRSHENHELVLVDIDGKPWDILHNSTCFQSTPVAPPDKKSQHSPDFVSGHECVRNIVDHWNDRSRGAFIAKAHSRSLFIAHME